ncbi:MAG: hypothetical protein AAGG48_08120 [Planctomycetota bacterium]
MTLFISPGPLEIVIILTILSVLVFPILFFVFVLRMQQRDRLFQQEQDPLNQEDVFWDAEPQATTDEGNARKNTLDRRQKILLWGFIVAALIFLPTWIAFNLWYAVGPGDSKELGPAVRETESR